MDFAQENYDALMGLPIVRELLRKNKKLRKENRSLRNLICSIPEFRCECRSNARTFSVNANVNIKTETECEPTQCETLVDDDDVVLVQAPPVDNIVYVIDEDNIEKSVNVIGVTNSLSMAHIDDEEVEEDEDVPDEESEYEEEEVEVVTKAKIQEPDLEEEEEEEEEDAVKEAKAEESDSEVFEIQIAGKSYYTTNEINGTIYSIDDNEEVGDVVGTFKDGKPIFNKKKK